jgi:DNA-binding NtrC family response regulator
MHIPAVAKLLILDDEAAQMTALCNTLEHEGYATTGFTSANDALDALRGQEFDLVLTDLMMPEMDGITLLRAAQEIDRNLVGILMTGQGTIDTAVEAMKAGALDYILKPFRLSCILPVLSRALAVPGYVWKTSSCGRLSGFQNSARRLCARLQHQYTGWPMPPTAAPTC